jgi:hypothetical protein
MFTNFAALRYQNHYIFIAHYFLIVSIHRVIIMAVWNWWVIAFLTATRRWRWPWFWEGEFMLAGCWIVLWLFICFYIHSQSDIIIIIITT